MLTAAQIYAIARAAGFPPVVAVTMTAIALRESSGDPNAFNGNAATGDRSFGLWQINMRDAGIAKLMREKVLQPLGANTQDECLLDPSVNAKAAFLLWGNSNKNLNVAWRITTPGMYQARYEAYLPAAQAAAIAAGV